MFDTAVNGCSAAGLVDPASVAELEPGQLGQLISASHRVESVLIARRLAAIAALLRQRSAADHTEADPEHAAITGYEQTCAEVSALMNLSPVSASYQVHYAEALHTRLPRVAGLFASGVLDWRTVQVIIARTDLVDDEVIASLDEKLAGRAGRWSSWSRQRVVNTIDAAVLELDPDAARQRRKNAHRDRFIAVASDRDGMADVYGKVAVAHATAFDRRLSQLATEVCAEDPRSMDQRRADALAALTEGRSLACRCGRPECPARGGDTPAGTGTRVVLNVVATAEAITGASERPGYLEGYGVIDAEQVRELAASAPQRLVETTVDAAAALRYHPSPALARAIRCRDLTCRFPGCCRPASRCDLDHTIPFNHADPATGGKTVAGNIKCLCRFHHRLKTFGCWRDKQLPDGTVIWTSPTGQVFRTTPGGLEVIPELGDALSTTAHPPMQGRRRTRTRQRAAQVAHGRRHNRITREANELHAARQREIEDRKFRNHMRDMLFLFKGTPSTSPYCTWVNDPREPEELPPDWVPPPPAPPQPDDPPF
jgi:hypothetical protein